MPGLARTFVHDRDTLMVDALWNLAGKAQEPDARPITAVAVVGLPHLSGIERQWAERLQQQGEYPTPSVEVQGSFFKLWG